MNTIKIIPAQKRKLADVLYGQLLEQIMAGVLAPGDRLPSENAICSSFGVSRPVVREALLRLQADGLVESRRGSGTYLLRAPSPNVSRFAEPADIAGYLRAFEVRMAIESVAARYAAERRTHADLERIKHAARTFSETVSSGQLGQKLDIEFHRAIAMATHNEVFARQLDSLAPELEGFMGMALGLTGLGSLERKAVVLQEHQQIIDAIENGDGELASTYMQFHLSQARRRVTDATRQP